MPHCHELSRDEIYTIVNRHLGRAADTQITENSNVTIRRDGCDYYYLEEEVPANIGGWFSVHIDQYGKVIEFMPGM